jgi:hypothetical protein
LGIDPACVYVYLGQTLEEFGKSAFVLPFDAFSGTVSPFDTGGLVNHINPICAWTQDERRNFLKEYSWPAAEFPALLSLYPGQDQEEIRDYLAGNRPKKNGFHDLNPGLTPANLWTDNRDWRAWVWEGRRPDLIEVGTRLFKWTCPPEQYERIQQVALSTPDKNKRDWFLFLSKAYVRGGVTQLILSLRGYQEGMWLK